MENGTKLFMTYLIRFLELTAFSEQYYKCIYESIACLICHG